MSCLCSAIEGSLDKDIDIDMLAKLVKTHTALLETGGCGSHEEIQQPVWVAEERQRVSVCVTAVVKQLWSVRRGLKDHGKELRRQVQEKKKERQEFDDILWKARDENRVGRASSS